MVCNGNCPSIMGYNVIKITVLHIYIYTYIYIYIYIYICNSQFWRFSYDFPMVWGTPFKRLRGGWFP